MILPIATKPAQQSIINSWAKEIMNERVYAYGSVHPDAEDALDELEHIKQSGLFGVKLHPEYQLFYPDDEKLFPIYEKACELKLPVVFHGGYDPLSPDIIRGTPERFAAIAPICGSGICWNGGIIKHIPVMMYHGDQDEIVPISESVTMLKAISKNGGTAELKICYGYGHNAWDVAYAGDELMNWFFKHKKR